MLTTEDIRRFISERNLVGELVILPTETPTVETAAQALGVHVDQVVKSLVFWTDGTPTMVIANGLRRVDRGKLAAELGMSKNRVKLATPDATLEITGFPVGTMPPFGHRQPIPKLMDRHVLEHTEVYAGGGGIDTMLRISSQDLLKATEARVVEVTDTTPLET